MLFLQFQPFLGGFWQFLGVADGWNHQLTEYKSLKDTKQYPHHNTNANQQWFPQHQESLVGFVTGSRQKDLKLISI